MDTVKPKSEEKTTGTSRNLGALVQGDSILFSYTLIDKTQTCQHCQETLVSPKASIVYVHNTIHHHYHNHRHHHHIIIIIIIIILTQHQKLMTMSMRM